MEEQSGNKNGIKNLIKHLSPFHLDVEGTGAVIPEQVHRSMQYSISEGALAGVTAVFTGWRCSHRTCTGARRKRLSDWFDCQHSGGRKFVPIASVPSAGEIGQPQVNGCHVCHDVASCLGSHRSVALDFVGRLSSVLIGTLHPVVCFIDCSGDL